MEQAKSVAEDAFSRVASLFSEPRQPRGYHAAMSGSPVASQWPRPYRALALDEARGRLGGAEIGGSGSRFGETGVFRKTGGVEQQRHGSAISRSEGAA